MYFALKTPPLKLASGIGSEPQRIKKAVAITAAAIVSLISTSSPALTEIELKLSSALNDVANGRLASPKVSIAQSGSIGGSVAPQPVKGGEGKSVSGGRPAAGTRLLGAKKKRLPLSRNAGGTAKAPNTVDELPRRRRGNQCGRLAGVWTANGWWNSLYGRGDVVLNSNGSARHNSGIKGTYTCSGNHFVLDWKNWAHNEGTLSSDGNLVTFGGGATLSRGW